MKRLLALWLMPALAFGQSVTVNTNNLPVSSANPLYTLTTSQKNALGVPYVSPSGILPSYTASASFAATTGVLFALCGSSTKILTVRGFSISGSAGQNGNLVLQIVKTSTNPTAGTAITPVSLDSSNAAATGISYYYTSAPTPGTSVGTTYIFTQFFPSPSGGNNNQSPRSLDIAPGAEQLILRSANECVEVYTASTALTSPSVQITMAWTESDTFP